MGSLPNLTMYWLHPSVKISESDLKSCWWKSPQINQDRIYSIGVMTYREINPPTTLPNPYSQQTEKILLLFNCDLDFNLRIGEQAPVHLYVCANRLFFRSIPTPLGKTRPLWPGLEIFANINLNGSARGNHVFPQEFLESNKREFGRLKWRVWQGGLTFTR